MMMLISKINTRKCLRFEPFQNIFLSSTASLFLSLTGCFVEVWLGSYISVINIDDRNESSTGYLLCTVYLKLLRAGRSKQAVVCRILSLSVVDTDTVPGVQGRGGGGWRRGEGRMSGQTEEAWSLVERAGQGLLG